MSSSTLLQQKGVSLLEVLVAILILSFGLLGLAALQTNALRNNQSSFQRSQAVMLTYFIVDAIRVDRANVGSYTMGKTCTAPAAGSLAAATKKTWIETIQTNLGTSACGEITCNTGDCTIKIYWNDERAIGGYSTQVFETRTRL